MRRSCVDRRKARSGEDGFTLLEVMASVTILAMGVALVLGLFSGALSLASRSVDRTREAALAGEKMAEALVSGGSEGGLAGTAPGGLEWKTEITPLTGSWEGLSKIVVTVGREGRGEGTYSVTALAAR